MYDYLIIGSGLFGSVFAYFARKKGFKCLVIEKRDHFGGNVYCENVEGINVHKYGAHIFHTSNEKVWNFVNSFVPFNHYINSPLANYKGKMYNLPFNMNTFNKLWGCVTPDEAMQMVKSQQAEERHRMSLEGIAEPQNLEQQAKLLVGEDIYRILIKDYTEKQWGRSCAELPPFIIKRLPVRFTYDNNYFNDRFQGVPMGGYNKLIEGLLNGIETRLGVDYFTDRQYWNTMAGKMVYTGPLDEYFDYCYGKLDWRTVSFKTKVMDTPNYQGNAVVNYTSHVEPYTRVIEHKHFEMFGQAVYDCPKTVVSEEYSCEYRDGMEPFYAINDERNNALAERYRQRANEEKNVLFGGRLAEYKYYDMAPVIEKVMGLFE